MLEILLFNLKILPSKVSTTIRVDSTLPLSSDLRFSMFILYGVEVLGIETTLAMGSGGSIRVFPDGEMIPDTELVPEGPALLKYLTIVLQLVAHLNTAGNMLTSISPECYRS